MDAERAQGMANALVQAADDHAMRSNPDALEITHEMRLQAAKEVLPLFLPMFSIAADLMKTALEGSFEFTKKPLLTAMPPAFQAGYVAAWTEMLTEIADAGESLPKNERLMAIVSAITLALMERGAT